MLFQVKSLESGIDLQRRIQSLKDRLVEMNLADNEKKRSALKTNYCGADSGDKNVALSL